MFDHWFSEVPSQTMANRSFWTAATSSGFVVNRPVTNSCTTTTPRRSSSGSSSTGRTWKVYVLEPDPISFTGLIHMGACSERFATHFVPFAEFERDAAAGTLPDFSLIEPNLMAGHCDYHPAFGRALLPGVEVADRPAVVDPRRRSVPGPHLRRRPVGARLTDRLQRLQHDALRRLGRARRDL